MGSIPLPALGVRPPEQPANPVDQYAKAVQLKSMLQAQQMQQGQLQIQQQQIKDQQAHTKALTQWDGKNPDDIPNLILKNGGSGDAALNMRKMLLQQKSETLDLVAKQGTEAKRQSDLTLGAKDAVQNAPAAQRPQVYQQQLQGLQQAGVDVSKFPQQYPGDDGFKALGNIVQLHSVQVEHAFKEREVAVKESEAKTQAKKADTEAARFKEEMPGGAMQPVEQKELSDFMVKNPGKGPSDFAKWKASLAPQAQINVQGGAIGSDLAAAVAKGDIKISDVLTARTPLPLRKQFLSQVLALNPNYKSYDFDIEKGVAKDFTSGKSAQNLTAFNTAIDHAKQLDKAIDALNNGNMTPLNELGNVFSVKMGNDSVTNFNVIKNALSGEISKVFKGGQATDAEIKAVQGPFDAANSPAQLRGAIKQAVFLMNSKRNALKEQYEKGQKATPNFGDEGGGSKEIHYKIVDGKLVAQ